MDKLNKLAIVAISISTWLGSQALSKDLLPIEVYAKCFMALTDHPVEANSANYKKVELGELDPVSACMQVMNRADFVSKNGIHTINDDSDKIAISILRKFNSFHRSWFTSYGDFVSNLGKHMSAIIDYDEPALFLTDALFGEKHFKSVYTRKDSIQGVRKSAPSQYNYADNVRLDNKQFIAGPIMGPNGIMDLSNEEALEGIFEFNFNPVDTGYLVGVKPTPSLVFKQRSSVVLKGPYDASDGSSLKDEEQEHDFSKPLGGGILSSSGYLYANAESSSRLDGGVRVHRRMANNTFYDLMCLPLPNLRNSDLEAYIQKYKGSQLSFRMDRACVGCHATLDPFADTFRNIMMSVSSTNEYQRAVRLKFPNKFPQAVNFHYFKKYKVRTNEQVVSDSDNIYHRRAPEGRLFYRNYEGKLVNKTVNGIEDLGTKIIEQDDVFMCAAQRYYQFLTGINIPVAVTENDEFYKKHRKVVVELGAGLKKHGSLKTLIKNILKTDAFQSNSPGLIVESEGAQ